mmetsp:Transcript_11775/g.30818  ORF Transcript_11775/g.30818 Transcript_11775/m.30818 type:complete len:92 (-) Transcript_11775:2732-3007(-)
MVAAPRRGDVQYRFVARVLFSGATTACRLLDKAAEASRRASLRSFCTNIRLKRRRKTQSRVYVILGIIAPLRRREALWPRIDRRGPFKYVF